MISLPPSSPPRIGLALGGGGARGLAHLHVIEALDDLGLRPAAVTGCSIGAIFGAAVAAGLSGADIREATLAALGRPGDVWGKLWVARPRNFSDIFGGLPIFDPEALLGAMLPIPLPETFAELRLPFAAVAADFYGAREVEITDGPLLRAVAASIALPAIFRPVEIDGVTLIDGGVVNPLPFDRLPVNVDIVIAVDVVGIPVRPESRGLPNASATVFGASQILMQALIAEKLKSRVPDVLIRPPVDEVGVLDFLKARDILDATAGVREIARDAIAAAVAVYERGGRRPAIEAGRRPF